MADLTVITTRTVSITGERDRRGRAREWPAPSVAEALAPLADGRIPGLQTAARRDRNDVLGLLQDKAEWLTLAGVTGDMARPLAVGTHLGTLGAGVPLAVFISDDALPLDPIREALRGTAWGGVETVEALRAPAALTRAITPEGLLPLWSRTVAERDVAVGVLNAAAIAAWRTRATRAHPLALTPELGTLLDLDMDPPAAGAFLLLHEAGIEVVVVTNGEPALLEPLLRTAIERLAEPANTPLARARHSALARALATAPTSEPVPGEVTGCLVQVVPGARPPSERSRGALRTVMMGSEWLATATQPAETALDGSLLDDLQRALDQV